MRQISNPIGPSAVVALVFMSAVSVSAGIGNARAEDCLAAPNGTSPAGQHWYYRIDRTTRRHCWYLAMLGNAHHTHRASVLANETAEQPVAVAPAPVAAAPVPFAAAPVPFPAAAMPIAAAPMPAPDRPMAESVPGADDTPGQPHVTVLAVKTIAMRPPGATAETRARHGAAGAPISEASARAYSATPEGKSNSPLFFVLVFGLGVATFLMAIVIKCVAPRASWPWWPARSEADFAWPRQLRNYSGAAHSRGG